MMVARARRDRHGANLPRDIFRSILDPMFGGIDRNNANRGDVLFGYQISDSGVDVRLSEDASIVTEAIDDKIHVIIITCQLFRRVPAPTHCQLLTKQNSENLSTRSVIVPSQKVR